MASDDPILLFPLPLNPLELAFLSVDLPQYPMQFELCWHVTRELDFATWLEACRAAVRRHPLFAATIGTGRSGQREWLAPTSYEPTVHQVESSNSVDHSPLDPHRAPGFRISVLSGEQGFQIWLHVHHTVSDALGAVQVLADIREHYFALMDDRPPELSPLDEFRLRGRTRFGLSSWGWCRRWPQDSLGLLGLYEYLFHRPVALGAILTIKEAPHVIESPPQTNLNTTLTAENTRRLSARARAEGVTVNDLLLTAGFLALHDTLTVNQPESADAVVRIMIPTNLRLPSDSATPAANIVSSVFLDRRPGRFHNSLALLRSVHREMRLCKVWKAGITLFRILSLKLWLSRGELPPPRLDRCLTTAVLSNLGKIRTVACDPLKSEGEQEPTVERLEFAPPIAPMTAVAWGVVTWNERLSLTLNFDRQRLSPADAVAIQRRFELRLEEWLSTPE